MFETSSAAMPAGYYRSNKKIYPKNNVRCRLSNEMPKSPQTHFPEPKPTIDDLDAEAFAKWLKDAYQKSSFKTITQLAEAVQSNKATISRLMTGASQTLTGKPSKPRVDLVMRLAEALGVSETEGLYYAGHPIFGRPYKKPTNLAEFLEQLQALGLEQFDFALGPNALEDYTEDDFQEVLDRIKADIEITIKRRTKK